MSRACSINDTELHGFKPFNEVSELVRIQNALDLYETTSDGMNTIRIDQFRQGVDISLPKYQFIGMQPKLWSGNICGFTRVNTYGQFENYVEFTGDPSYNDEKRKFDPVSYINNYQDYPYPLAFNDGPAQGYEASLEPFTIPFRKNTNEDFKMPARGIKGAFGDFEGFEVGQSQEYYEYTTHNHCDWFFLDSGTRYIGDGAVEDKIVIDGYVSFDEECISAFNDTRSNGPQNPLIDYLSSPDGSLISVLMSSSMDWNLDEDIRGTYTNRSTSAGYTVYGPSQRIYGTDSVSYNGWLRGS